MDTFENNIEMARKIALEVKKYGGTAYYVGGYVRDQILKIENKDIDIEIHGIAPNLLAEILDSLGERLSMGESFGIFGLKGYSIDIAMPRKEKQIGKGHRDFEMFVDPHIGIEKAAMRRDFTMNALMMDVLTQEILDPFGGISDIQNGIIRHINRETFLEDALRVFRCAQFAARFEFSVAQETKALCRQIPLDSLTKERVEAELKKALLKAEKPSVFFEILREMSALKVWFPEVSDLIGIPQNEKYHKEGDVWTHTMMVLDAAAKEREKTSNPFGFMLAALTHDFGKAICTETVDGVSHSYAHEVRGLPLVKRFLRRMTGERKLIDYVLNLTEYHMKPNVCARQKSSVKATNKMFDSVFSPSDLLLLAKADHFGRITEEDLPYEEEFLQERLRIYEETMAKPYVMGRDLITAGLQPNENFTEILAYAHKLRLACVEKELALKQTLAYARKYKKR